MENIRTKVVIGRKWNRPEIYTHLSTEKIELAVSLEDFVLALAAEIKRPAFIMSRSRLHTELLAAIPRVLSEVKKISAEVV